MSEKKLPFDPLVFLAQDVRKLLHDEGPLSGKEIVRRLRQKNHVLPASGVRKLLDHTMPDVEHLPGNVYRLRDEQ